MRQPQILVIDSGVGGLSIAQKIVHAIANAHIYYIADTLHFPYGSRDEDFITKRVETLIHDTLNHFRPDLAVIACNTASTVVLDHLRAQFAFPFIGVVPAIKPAALLSQNKIIAVLATQGTVSRTYTHNLIAQFASGCSVKLIACPTLVTLAEQKMCGYPVAISEINSSLTELQRDQQQADTVVLACTHFPLLKPELEQALPTIINWVDSGDAIARRALSLLGNEKMEATAGNKEPNIFHMTGKKNTYAGNLINNYLGIWISPQVI